MNQIQLYKLFFILVLLNSVFALVHKPTDNEQRIKLDIKNNIRTYYEIDKDGLRYDNIGKGFNLGDSIQIAIYSRTIKAPTGKKNRNYGFTVQLNNNDPIEIKYQKEGSKVTSPDRPGWNYTKSGIWHFYIPLKQLNNKIHIKPLKGNSVVYIRLISKIIEKKGGFGKILNTVNRQKRANILTFSKSKPTQWYTLDNSNVQQFEIIGPKKIRVFSRLSFENIDSSGDYYLFVRENGIDLGTYYFNTEISNESVESEKNISVGKWRSFWLNVPNGKHYYNISLSNIDSQKSKTVFIRLKEWNEE